ncbi:Mitochondrial import inner membrane translocase subunit Tim22 [Porphyridium purpureum]|uniref:Mitochondrial import inner membrane translocase subunit TIM22 n=1 Tax=Porphyridium purpureum TaxID=35688 RepID=A0A5J4Z0J1_PORPP|nr:Mitochondrial import inner membrane translocase subunit Tim22 [Porphyridium purpureum]|eukprot:POR8783..scf208_2
MQPPSFPPRMPGGMPGTGGGFEGMTDEEKARALGAMQATKFLNAVGESCAFKALLSTVAGGGIGLFFGLLFGGYAQAVDEAVESKGTTVQRFRVGFKSAGRAMGSYAKSFAIWGAVFSSSECAIESYRARHDIWNSVAAGCVTGATLASAPKQSIGAKARIQQMAVACAGMAAFSGAIDLYMDR